MFLSQAAIDAVFAVDVDHDSFSRRPAHGGAEALPTVPGSQDPRGLALPGRSLVSEAGSTDVGPAR